MSMPKQIHIFLNLIGLFVIIYIGVNTFYKVVEIKSRQVSGPKVIELKDIEDDGSKKAVLVDYKLITKRNIFGTTAKAAPPPEPEVKKIETLEPTSLSVSLLGTIISDEENTRAIIYDRRKKNQNLYQMGDIIQGALIKQILRNKVVLHVNGRDEILFMVEADSDKPKPKRRSSRRYNRNRRSRSR